MIWNLRKDKKKILGWDSYTINIFKEDFHPGIDCDKLNPIMGISIFEVLESLPREYVRDFMDYLDEEEKRRRRACHNEHT